MDSSRTTARLSLRTHHRLQKQTKINKFVCERIAYVFICICIIVIIYQILKRNRGHKQLKNGTPDKQDLQPIKEFSNVVNEQLNRQDLDHWAIDNQITIPLINLNSAQCQKKQHHLEQENKNNLFVFNVLRKQKQYQRYTHHKSVARSEERQTLSHVQTLQKYFIQIKPLFALKHPKFTSASKSWSSQMHILSFLFDNDEEKYKNLNKIFINTNLDAWQSSGKYLTFMSDSPIKPTLLIINLPQSILEQTSSQSYELYIFGLSAYETVLANNNTLSSILITKVKVKQGINIIECDKVECNDQYSMIMLVMQTQIKVRGIRVFSRKNYIKNDQEGFINFS